MEACLKRLGVPSRERTDLFRDDISGTAACGDASKVAFHAFRTKDSYIACWNAMRQAMERTGKLRTEPAVEEPRPGSESDPVPLKHDAEQQHRLDVIAKDEHRMEEEIAAHDKGAEEEDDLAEKEQRDAARLGRGHMGGPPPRRKISRALRYDRMPHQ